MNPRDLLKGLCPVHVVHHERRVRAGSALHKLSFVPSSSEQSQAGPNAANPHPHRETLQGLDLTLTDPSDRAAAIERAFDYRGDVTIYTTDGRVIEGYIFDRCRSAQQPYLRLIPSDGTPRRTINYADIVRVVFSGRDTAAGKSWEAWVKRYAEKKARGEPTDAEPEKLEP